MKIKKRNGDRKVNKIKMNILFYFYKYIICPHPKDYIDWVNDEWESYWFCTVCYRGNLWEKLKLRLKLKLYPYKNLIDYRVWLIKSKLNMINRESKLTF